MVVMAHERPSTHSGYFFSHRRYHTHNNGGTTTVAPPPYTFPIVSLPTLSPPRYITGDDHPDLAPLMAFKASSDGSNRLTSWTNSSDPCSTSSAFYGVSCLHNRVTRLVLEDLELQGRFDSLASLTQLRILSLKRNRLTGPVPDLSNLTSLKLLFLSSNQISGEFPASVPSLFGLYRLDLSYNNFSGEIPATINRMNHLLTLRLEENQFSGSISFLQLQNLQEFNISGNQVSGEIPSVLSSFQNPHSQTTDFCADYRYLTVQDQKFQV
ncbi:hypothetical protein R6Q59_005380 [Mikania micrantha]